MNSNLEKLKDYLEDEYRSTVNILTREELPWWLDNPNESKHLALQRGLGAVMYAQWLGEKYEDVEVIYEEYKTAIEAIIPTTKKEKRGI